MGPTIESRFANNGAPNGGISASNIGAEFQGKVPDNKGKWLIITAISTALLLIVVVILLVMILGREEKVCTYEDVMETIEKDDLSPSENWKIYEDYDFHDSEDSLKIFAKVMVNGALQEEDFDEVVKWSRGYVGIFGGEALSESAKLTGAEVLETDGGGTEMRWRLLAETDEGCARFDVSKDFSVLEQYSLTAGNCDEFRE